MIVAEGARSRSAGEADCNRSERQTRRKAMSATMERPKISSPIKRTAPQNLSIPILRVVSSKLSGINAKGPPIPKIRGWTVCGLVNSPLDRAWIPKNAKRDPTLSKNQRSAEEIRAVFASRRPPEKLR